MARYIDADKAEPYFFEHLSDNGMIGAQNALNEMPTEDVAPVIHADWIGVNPLVDTIECSRCGYEWFTHEIATPYCPECGATMDNYKEIGEIGLPVVEVSDDQL